MFISWWRVQDIFTRNNLLFYLSEEFYTTEQKLLNASICLFPPFGKIKIAGGYEDKPTYENHNAILLKILFVKLRRQLSFTSLSSFFRNNAFI